MRMNTYAKVKQNMNNLGIYKPEFDDVIRVYADLLDEYKKSKGGSAKAYKVTELRKLIKQYAETLRLTPKAYKPEEEDGKPRTKLDAVFDKITKLQDCG